MCEFHYLELKRNSLLELEDEWWKMTQSILHDQWIMYDLGILPDGTLKMQQGWDEIHCKVFLMKNEGHWYECTALKRLKKNNTKMHHVIQAFLHRPGQFNNIPMLLRRFKEEITIIQQQGFA